MPRRVLLLALTLLVAGCGGGPAPHAAPPEPTPPAGTPAPAHEPLLAVGITEPNPNFLRPTGAAPQAARWRDALAAMHPAYYRLVIDWAHIQPQANVPANLALPEQGCARAVQPCLPYAGVRDQLRALAARQRESGGWQTLVTVTDTPPWAAGPSDGCQKGAAGARSAAVRADAIPAYRALIRGILAEARRDGAQLRWWSPWNEPNHPFFFPQRTACDAAAPSRAVAAYVPLARALIAELKDDGDPHELALGELAAVRDGSPVGTSVAEFIAALPKDLLCSAGVWSQHAYIGGGDPVSDVVRALRARGCGSLPPIWITETGVGAADSRLSIARGIAGPQAGCRLLHRRLVRWWHDPHVAAAFQYTLRDDPAFPTGLVLADLSAARPTLAEWQAWGSRSRPDDPPPPSACGG